MGFLNKIRNVGNIFGTGKGLSADTGARKLDGPVILVLMDSN